MIGVPCAEIVEGGCQARIVPTVELASSNLRYQHGANLEAVVEITMSELVRVKDPDAYMLGRLREWIHSVHDYEGRS